MFTFYFFCVIGLTSFFISQFNFIMRKHYLFLGWNVLFTNAFMHDLYVFSSNLCNHNVHLAEDMISQLYLKLLEDPPDHKKIINIRSYVRQMLKNQILDYYRNKSKLPTKTFTEYTSHKDSDAFENFTSEDFSEYFNEEKRITGFQVLRFATKLNPKYKKIFKLKFLEDNTDSEIALKLNEKVTTVKTEIHRIRKKIHSEF